MLSPEHLKLGNNLTKGRAMTPCPYTSIRLGPLSLTRLYGSTREKFTAASLSTPVSDNSCCTSYEWEGELEGMETITSSEQPRWEMPHLCSLSTSHGGPLVGSASCMSSGQMLGLSANQTSCDNQTMRWGTCMPNLVQQRKWTFVLGFGAESPLAAFNSSSPHFSLLIVDLFLYLSIPEGRYAHQGQVVGCAASEYLLNKSLKVQLNMMFSDNWTGHAKKLLGSRFIDWMGGLIIVQLVNI